MIKSFELVPDSNDSTLHKFLKKGGDRMTKEFVEKCKKFRFLL